MRSLRTAWYGVGKGGVPSTHAPLASPRAGGNGPVRVRSASVSLNSIVRPASCPRPFSFSPGRRGRGRQQERGGREGRRR
eukprot:gene7569-biopygen3064